jgi:hypothetical protein
MEGEYSSYLLRYRKKHFGIGYSKTMLTKNYYYESKGSE